jgi:2-keto-4-pentenoate hydratase/2-oxohepta-3-ene-1,7-dioic acid hydratase in catechol pathway
VSQYCNDSIQAIDNENHVYLCLGSKIVKTVSFRQSVIIQMLWEAIEMMNNRSKSLMCFVGVTLAGLVAASWASAGDEVVRYARFEHEGRISYGIVENDRIRRLQGDLFGEWAKTDEVIAEDQVKLLAPVVPPKVLAVARNYRSHAGDDISESPEIFFKVPTAVIGPGEDIVLPEGAENVHFEAELVVVMAREARNVSIEQAPDYILGVTCGNDVSAREWQKNDVQWWRAKSCDTFAPCGPYIVSGLDYNDLLLQLRQNGEVKQQQRTRDLAHSVAATVSWISRHLTLEPGDLIYTGTPGKTAAMAPGDVIEVELEGVGVLRNTVRSMKD